MEMTISEITHQRRRILRELDEAPKVERTRDSIAADVAVFLNAGGKVMKMAVDASGVKLPTLNNAEKSIQPGMSLSELSEALESEFDVAVNRSVLGKLLARSTNKKPLTKWTTPYTIKVAVRALQSNGYEVSDEALAVARGA